MSYSSILKFKSLGKKGCRNPFLKGSNIVNFLMKQQITTRAGLAINPLEGYIPTSLTTVANNVLPTHGDYAYVGGTEETFEYDFYLKTAGDSAHPLELKGTSYSTLKSPTDLWSIYSIQGQIDSVKTIDGNVHSRTSSVTGEIPQLMVELNLTELVNKLSGGSNADFKSNKIKSIQVDVYAKGGGYDSASDGYKDGCSIKAWLPDYTSWSNYFNSGVTANNTPSIAKCNIIVNGADAQNRFGTNNKFYVLVASSYPAGTKVSDGTTVSSTVSLDYIKITILTNRVADVIPPVSVNLPTKWSMLVKGFSPNWSSDAVYKRIFSLWQNDNTRASLYTLNGSISFSKRINGATVTSLSTGIPITSKNQCINFIVGQSDTGMFAYVLKNNGTVTKYTNTNVELLTGQFPLYLLNQNGAEQANALAESFHFMPDYVPTDAEASDILKLVDGNKAGVVNKNLFSLDKIVPNGNSSIINGSLVLNLSSAWNGCSSIIIPVLPNNQYELAAVVPAGGNVYADPFYNATQIKNTTPLTFTNNKTTITTDSITTGIKLTFVGDAVGTFTFSQLSLKLKM